MSFQPPKTDLSRSSSDVVHVATPGPSATDATFVRERDTGERGRERRHLPDRGQAAASRRQSRYGHRDATSARERDTGEHGAAGR